MTELTHFDGEGASRMVDVAAKPITERVATASGRVRMKRATLELVRDLKLAKGNVLEVARLAGILAAKQTAGLIPLCHQVPLDAVELAYAFPDPEHVVISATARATARTGVEMEALVAVNVAALTIYDMCKAVDREMVIEQVQLEEKSGGRSGHFRRASQGAGE
jgi:cyclic pyranopterin monophosphate synthase